MLRSAAVALSAVIVLMGAEPAAAHPRFVSSTPARGAALTSAPKEIRVTFSETVLVGGSNFQVLDAAGKPVRTGRLSTPQNDPKTIVVPLIDPLSPGAYRVQWRVAASGHSIVPGRFPFEVKR